VHHTSSVRSEFRHAWDAYRKFAWGFDELRPLTLTGRNWYDASLLLTPIDVLDSLVILGFDDEADETLNLIASDLDFDRDVTVNLFEANIRVMGGLLSGFQFTNEPRLLDLADDLGRRLLPAFDSPTGIPYRFINLQSAVTSDARTNPAEAGTLVLEFGRLSELTGDESYREAAKRALVALFERRSTVDLVGSWIDVESGDWLDHTSHIAGLIDSYYEYLIKGWKLFGDDELGSMWNTHFSGIREHVIAVENDRTWCRRVDMNSGEEVAPHYGALDAFFVGTLVLAGEIETAAALQSSGFDMWNRFGLEPEVFDYRQMDVAGDEGAYHLRPELAESAAYLFWATGHETYRDMGAQILKDLINHCRTPNAYAAVADVRTMEKLDSMESFFLAETLKYLFLLFDDQGGHYFDDYVFTTEAHPLRKGD
jgi:mannosidase alpha-like ER degradation enhancer 2